MGGGSIGSQLPSASGPWSVSGGPMAITWLPRLSGTALWTVGFWFSSSLPTSISTGVSSWVTTM